MVRAIGRVYTPKLGAYASGLGERCAPPAASRCSRAARVRAPSRGDPPHDGRFAQHLPPAPVKGVAVWTVASFVRSALCAFRPSCCAAQRLWPSLCDERGQHVRGGSPREGARSELASAAATGGGGRAQRSPDPDHNLTRMRCITRTPLIAVVGLRQASGFGGGQVDRARLRQR